MNEQSIRQILLDFVEALKKEGGLDNVAVAKLHFDLTADKLKNLIEGLPVGLIDSLNGDWDKWSERVDKL